MFKYNSAIIERDLAAEKQLGIQNLQVNAYEEEGMLDLVGQIEATAIKHPFILRVEGYDKQNKLVLTETNDGYGNEVVTNIISNQTFFNGYPFEISAWNLDEVIQVSRLKVFPVEVSHAK
ncbi:hypothetical protein [Lactobacillus sp. 3B(2020)]|uniref:hypothetical protein n=1 Tax=Lactobacillus sp. 3B(2020) TaxID=2695882 RepID=UPI0015DD8D23|nr:hypothetical protein [Lactobacillus sp. 3B(2020)]QLL70400.1 hypothetical protein GTO83_07640 [Lactobacillus sp. 3B(2020)]